MDPDPNKIHIWIRIGEKTDLSGPWSGYSTLWDYPL